MKQLRASGLAGPVGFSLMLVGYSVAVLVARAFVSLIAHCIQSCPSIRIEGFHIHHFYYGLGLVLISVVALGFVEDVRTRWDAGLVLGIGAGLIFDEAGLVVLGAHYWDSTSVLPIIALGLVMSLGLVYTLRLRGLSDFGILDTADVLTFVSVLLAVTGFLYFVRPVRVFVSTAAVASWALAVLLMGVYGRKHLLKILRGQFQTDR